MIKKVELQTQQSELLKACQAKPQSAMQEEVSSIEKSLYNTKGSNVYFCGMVKCLNQAEEVLADGLRAIKENGRKKFNEHDVRDIMEALRKNSKAEDKEEVLIMSKSLLDPDWGLEVDNKTFKRVVGALANRTEEERYAILEFAQYEARNATNPMNTFTKLPKETQDELTGFLHDIKELRYGDLFADNELDPEMGDGLYDLFKVAMYAHEDLPKLSAAQAKLYKQEQMEIIASDIEYLQKYDQYKTPEQKEKVVQFAKNIHEYFSKTFVNG